MESDRYKCVTLVGVIYTKVTFWFFLFMLFIWRIFGTLYGTPGVSEPTKACQPVVVGLFRLVSKIGDFCENILFICFTRVFLYQVTDDRRGSP